MNDSRRKRKTRFRLTASSKSARTYLERERPLSFASSSTDWASSTLTFAVTFSVPAEIPEVAT